jgi:hypothetical protein
MNCLQLRHRAQIAPRELTAGAQQHLSGCPGCAAFVEKLAAFEETLEREVRIPIPDGLADRVLLQVRQQADALPAPSSALERMRAAARRITHAVGLTELSRGPQMFVAFAAAVILAIGTVLFYPSLIQDEGLAIAEIAHDAHVMQERLEDLGDVPATDPGALESVLAASGIRLPSDFREIRYVGPCGPADRTGQHIVMQTPSGMASLVLMPGESARFRIVQFDDGRTAVVAPAAVGSWAVVADSRETAVQLAARLL